MSYLSTFDSTLSVAYFFCLEFCVCFHYLLIGFCSCSVYFYVYRASHKNYNKETKSFSTSSFFASIILCMVFSSTKSFFHSAISIISTSRRSCENRAECREFLWVKMVMFGILFITIKWYFNNHIRATIVVMLHYTCKYFC